MKSFKLFLYYSFIFLFLTSIYDEKTMQFMYFHYSLFDFRYLIFISLIFFWVTILFHILYQYICLYPFMRIRLKTMECIKIFIKQLFRYCIIYISIHYLLFTIFYFHVPTYDLFINLLIQILGFILVVMFHFNWDYSYMLLSGFIIISHLFI